MNRLGEPFALTLMGLSQDNSASLGHGGNLSDRTSDFKHNRTRLHSDEISLRQCSFEEGVSGSSPDPFPKTVT
jgi:hypothetical protein